MQKNWLDIFNEIGRDPAAGRQKPPEPTRAMERQIPSPPPPAAAQRRTEALTASTRAALVAAIDEGRTARALDIALQAIAELTGDRELMDRNAQDRAAMGEEWRRAYKVWSAHIPRIRAAQTSDEAMDALDKAYDACKTISDETGQDGLSVALGMMEICEREFKVRYDALCASGGGSERMPWEIEE